MNTCYSHFGHPQNIVFFISVTDIVPDFFRSHACDFLLEVYILLAELILIRYAVCWIFVRYGC